MEICIDSMDGNSFHNLFDKWRRIGFHEDSQTHDSYGRELDDNIRTLIRRHIIVSGVRLERNTFDNLKIYFIMTDDPISSDLRVGGICSAYGLTYFVYVLVSTVET